MKNDIVIEGDIDNNWYKMMLVFTIMLIWDDVVIDHVVVVVENDIEMIWYWCWEWHWDEMMLMLIMTLRWYVVDVENVIVMMCDVYVHGGCRDHVGYPWWGKYSG